MRKAAPCDPMHRMTCPRIATLPGSLMCGTKPKRVLQFLHMPNPITKLLRLCRLTAP